MNLNNREEDKYREKKKSSRIVNIVYLMSISALIQFIKLVGDIFVEVLFFMICIIVNLNYNCRN